MCVIGLRRKRGKGIRHPPAVTWVGARGGQHTYFTFSPPGVASTHHLLAGFPVHPISPVLYIFCIILLGEPVEEQWARASHQAFKGERGSKGRRGAALAPPEARSQVVGMPPPPWVVLSAELLVEESRKSLCHSLSTTRKAGARLLVVQT